MWWLAVAFAAEPSSACWDRLVHEHVRDGVVDYPAFAGPARPALEACAAELAAVPTMAGWSRAAQTAWWINVYNAYTVLLIVQNPGIKSIRDIGWPLSSPWKQVFIPMAPLRGHALSLDEVEHEILRKEAGDPRIHAALVCASKSCPTLRSEAFTAEQLDVQLASQMTGFLADPTKNRVDASGLHLSKIFSWYGGDFDAIGGVRGLLARSGPEAMRAVAATAPIDFLAYDWSLNGP